MAYSAMSVFGIGEIFSLGSAAVWALAVILFKQSGTSLSPTALNMYKNAIAVGLIVLTIAVLPQSGGWPDFTPLEWVLLIASGVIGIALADNLYFAALQNMGASRTGIASSLYSPAIIVMSFLFLGESLNGYQAAGFLLVLCAVILVSYKSDRREVSSRALRLGLVYAVSAVVLMAVGVIMVKRILEQDDFIWVVGVRLVSGFVGLTLFVGLRGQLTTVFQQIQRTEHLWRAGIASFLGSYLAMIFWLAGYKYTSASVASVLNETASIFIVVLSALLLAEPLTRRKILGVSMSFVGVTLMVVTSTAT